MLKRMWIMLCFIYDICKKSKGNTSNENRNERERRRHSDKHINTKLHTRFYTKYKCKISHFVCVEKIGRKWKRKHTHAEIQRQIWEHLCVACESKVPKICEWVCVTHICHKKIMRKKDTDFPFDTICTMCIYIYMAERGINIGKTQAHKCVVYRLAICPSLTNLQLFSNLYAICYIHVSCAFDGYDLFAKQNLCLYVSVCVCVFEKMEIV